MRYDYDYDYDMDINLYAPDKFKCDECGGFMTDLDVVMEDIGYGVTEFWGSKSVHECWIPTCPHCGSGEVHEINFGTKEYYEFLEWLHERE